MNIDVLIPLLIFLGLGLIVAMIRWPKIWLGTVLLALPVFFFDTGLGYSVSEIAMGGFFTVTILLWISARLTKPEPLIQWWPEFLILLFIVLSSANLIVALLNDVKFIDWLSDWSLYFLLLYYFPLRDVFGVDEKGLRQFLVLCGLVSLSVVAYSVYEYRTRAATGMLYAYQLMSSRSRLGGPVFQLAILIGIPSMLFAKTMRAKFMLLVFILINVAGLLQTFTRSLWVVLAASVVVMLPLLPWRKQISVVLGTCAIIVMAYFTALTVNPRLTKLATKILEKRVTSSTQLKGGDYSFETRLIEADKAIRRIESYPMGGNGLRARFVSWDPIVQHHTDHAFIHIGYLGLMYKFGIPLSIIVVTILVAFCMRALVLGWRHRRGTDASPLIRAVALGAFAFVPSLLVVIFVAGFIDQRYGIAMLTSYFALTTIGYNLSKGSESIKNTSL